MTRDIRAVCVLRLCVCLCVCVCVCVCVNVCLNVCVHQTALLNVE